MKILQVCPHFYGGGVGGVVEYVKNVSKGLARRGHEVTVFSTDPRKNFPRCEIIDGVTVERFRRYAPNKAYFFSLEMLLRLKNSHYDIVHGHCYHAFPMHFSTLAKRKKFIISTHFHGVGHSTFRNSLMRLLRPFGERTLRKADKIIAVSKYEKNLLLRQFNLDSKKIVVIPCGVNYAEFRNLKKGNKNFKSILYVGRLDNYKGVQYLVEVLPKLDENIILEIIGKGSLRKFLEERSRRLKVHDRVKFYQDLSKQELYQKYVDSDLFVLLSSHEAYSIAVAEALAAGIPCIVANTSALSEWVDNKTCFGLNFPINIQELADLITDILSGKCVRNTSQFLGTKIKDWNEIIKEIESIYME